MEEDDATIPPTKDKATILVDGSNIAYGRGQGQAPSLGILELIVHTLREEGFDTVVMVDAALRHTIDRPKELDGYIRAGEFIQTPAKTSADDFLMHMALRMQNRNQEVYILTNDTFPVKREKGIIRRIAYLIVPLKGQDELLFNPPLNALSKQDEIPEPAPPTQVAPLPVVEKRGDVDPLILDSVYNFISQVDPPAMPGTKVAFSSLANYLHNLFDGDFATRFGYGKPKDFAEHLSDKGFVKLFQEDGTPLFLELDAKLVEESRKFDQGINHDKEEIPEPVSGEEMDYLKAVFESIEKECHYATDEKIAIKIKNAYPDTEIDAAALIKKALDAKVIVRDKWKKKNVYWPVDRRWDAIHPDDYTDPYSQEQWNDFVQAIHKLPSSEQMYQTRYHMARNIADVGITSIAALPQAKREHMVQLAVNKRILDTDFTDKGIRISVKMDSGVK